MFSGSWKTLGWFGAIGTCAAVLCAHAQADRYADTLGYFEPGNNVDAVFGSDPVELYDNALAALGGPGQQVSLSQGTFTETVSLGGWSDDPATGTHNQSPGLVIGFGVEVFNIPGDDLLVVGNAPSAFKFYEPGFVEVAFESDGGGAKPSGWQDETFYLLRPGNFDQINDPRTANNPISITNNPDFSLTYSAPFDDDTNLPGYFDVTPGGDAFNFDDAIDGNGDPVFIGSIAYVRLRSVSDSAFPFGTFLAPEVDYLQAYTLEGDYNNDGFVGIDDLNIVLGNWNTSVPSGSLQHGDGNGDGFVGIDDLNQNLANWNAGSPPTGAANTVPEPTSLFICLTALGALTTRRR